MRIPPIAQALLFFAGCLAVGVVLVVLAALDRVHPAGVVGFLGLVGVIGGVYMLARGFRLVRAGKRRTDIR